jgi:hypothetical protein
MLLPDMVSVKDINALVLCGKLGAEA